MDLSNITIMTKEEFINTCHTQINIPSLIILFVSFVFFFLLFGLIMVKKSRGKILAITGLAVLFSGLVFLFLYLNPLITQNIVNWFSGLK